MFLPDNNRQQEERERKAAFRRIEDWVVNLIEAPIRSDVTVSVQEVQCGDPECAPVDTMITIQFPSGGQGIMGLPMLAKEVTEEILAEQFPPADIIQKWHRGEEAEWPPEADPTEMAQPPLRFTVGTRVLCRIGPDPVQDWAPGSVIQLWYREPNWPRGSFAPYKIRLDDGRDIFAPGDLDQIIRRNEAVDATE